jgi:MEMO1 family protein
VGTAVQALYATGHFEWMTQAVDEAEHSLELHMPYLVKALSTYVTA